MLLSPAVTFKVYDFVFYTFGFLGPLLCGAAAGRFRALERWHFEPVRVVQVSLDPTRICRGASGNVWARARRSDPRLAHDSATRVWRSATASCKISILLSRAKQFNVIEIQCLWLIYRILNRCHAVARSPHAYTPSLSTSLVFPFRRQTELLSQNNVWNNERIAGKGITRLLAR